MTALTTVFVFDLDATITECEILPRLAAPLGLSKEIAELTARTVSGQIPVEQSLHQRFDIIKQIPLPTIHAIIDSIPLQKDIETFIKKSPELCSIITGNIGEWLHPLSKKLGCRIVSSYADYTKFPAVLSEVTDKEQAVKMVRHEYEKKGYKVHIVAIGDGAGDIPMFKEADTSIAFAGVHPLPLSLSSIADYIIEDGKVLVRMLTSMLVGSEYLLAKAL